MTADMVAPTAPTIARLLLGAAVLSFAAVLLGDGFGVGSPPLVAPLWNNAYHVTQILAVAACALRARSGRSGDRAAWAALAAGLAGFTAADLYYVAVLEDLESPPYPSAADAGYLSIYPAGYVALVLLLRARAGRLSPALWLDGLIAALGAGAIGAALTFGVVASTDGPFATVATNLAYPLGDLSILSFVVAVIALGGRRAGRAWVLIALGFAVFAVADTIYLYQTATGTYEEHTMLDVGWPASFLLLAFAAWQPTVRLDARLLRGAGMLAGPATLALVSTGMLLLDHYSRLNDLALWLASAAVCVMVVRFALTFRENLRMLRASEEEAMTDALTGLGNRRALVERLEEVTGDAGSGASHVVALFDLDGFKAYNDGFGHPAGDALLVRLGRAFGEVLAGRGSACRMGGDEFCLVAPVRDRDDAARLVEEAVAALTEQGHGFRVTSSSGMALIPQEAGNPSDALRLADQRLYVDKRGGRQSTDETIHRVLLRVVAEHDGELREHVADVARLAERVARHAGLTDAEVTDVHRAAALHDIGKIAIPDAILQARRPLDAEEWAYMKQHTLIGERIISAAPQLQRVAEIVRASHERYDGRGYPNGVAGADIPLGARIVAACDAYDAMTTDRPYRDAVSPAEALAELRRCAGTQFDPGVVAALAAVLATPADAELALHAA
ncbi:MAG TPA: HD domain-containing phosphohydrolase, partial [Solirubrobacteraceae bacterium]|nr:HD domain-containing phosphohydrolase [Solirubrobacteraceae bacterium]